MRTLDAILLAGEKEGAIPVKGKNKALLSIRGKMLIEWVIDALDRSEAINSITVVGPEEKLGPIIEKIETEKPLKLLNQGNNIFENIWSGSLSTFPGYYPGIMAEELRKAGHEEKAIFIITSDVPLIDPVEIDDYIKRASLDKYDIVHGFTSKKILDCFLPKDGKPGITFYYYCVKEDILRHSNITIMKPLKLAHTLEYQIPLIYKLRYQRHLKNVIAAIKETIKLFPSPYILFLSIVMPTLMFLDHYNFHFARDIIRGFLKRDWVTFQASRIFKTRFVGQRTIGPGPTLDVDDDKSYQAFMEMWDEWKEIQSKQISGE
jgi:CTP:molybdopterin cytidylyltransferase MocA